MDINPLAVELAKLSLWIATSAKGVPLSFLNHHLRCGDSLLGVFSDEFRHDLFAQKLVQQMALAVKHIRLINDLSTKTLTDVGKKEEQLRVAREHLQRFRITYDSQLAPVLGLNVGEGFHAWLDSVAEPVPKALPAWLQEVERIASRFRFFHWELEFPEVWHDEFGRRLGQKNDAERTSPGFDLILGNPPFVRAQNEFARRAYMNRWKTAIKGFHLPSYRSLSVPSSSATEWAVASNCLERVREEGIWQKAGGRVLPQYTLEEVVDCSGLVFPGQGTPTCIVVSRATARSDGEPTVVTATVKEAWTPPEDSPLWRSVVSHHQEGWLSRAVLIFPYNQHLEPLREPLPMSLKYVLEPYQAHLENLIIWARCPEFTHLAWFEYRRLARAKLKSRLNAIFPQISMYNHCYLSDHSVAFKEKAQAIVLKADFATERWITLVGLLNSSVILFILKQISFNKGPGKRGEQIARILWKHSSQTCTASENLDQDRDSRMVDDSGSSLRFARKDPLQPSIRESVRTTRGSV